MHALIDAAVSRARTVVSALLLILIAGVIAYVNVPKESSPDINIPLIYVSMHHDGISPEDAETMLVRPMEKELRSVEGVKEMRSTAYEGGANVLLEFEAGFDADTALDDVREKVDLAKTELPDDTDDPRVHEVNFSLFPVVVVTLSGNLPERALLAIAQTLQDEIEALPQVLEAELGGDRESQVDIIIDPAKIESYGLNANDLSNFLARSNKLVAAGAVDTGQGRFSIKVPGLLKTLEDIMSLPVKVEGDAVVKLSDIAEGRLTFKDPEGYARVNGRPALTLEVKKRTGENVIETIDAVRATVAAEQAHWPPGIDVAFIQDQSTGIRTMLSDLQNSVIAAVLLVMVVVVAALGLRTGLLVGIAIPGSFLSGILVLASFGLTINIVVLFALILAVGMLVDGAIVVTEYADRKMCEGVHRTEAYRQAAKRMAWPVIASTATTLAAFMPLLFWTGVVGEFMKFLPMTLLATLAASLVMALIFVPTLGALVGKPGEANPAVMKALAAAESGDVTRLEGFTGRYARLLKAALMRPLAVIGAVIAVLIGVQILNFSFGKGVEFFPDIEPEQALVNVHARGNLSIEEKDRFIWEVEERILDLPDFQAVYARSGAAPDEGAEDIVGTVFLEFKDWQERRPALEVFEIIRERTADLAGITIEVQKQEEGPPTGKPVFVELSARDPALLAAAVAHVRRGLDDIGGFVNIEDSRPLPGIEWEVRVDRAQASKFGIDVAAVGDLVQLVTKGLKFSDYRPVGADDEIDIVTRFPEAYRSIDQLARLRAAGEQGVVPLSNFVEISPRPKVSTINRTDGHRVMTVKADVIEETVINGETVDVLVDDKVNTLKAWLADNPVDPAVTLAFKGEDQEQRESEAFLIKAFGVALFIMAIILVTQFNSFYSAFLILSAVVLSTMGVMLGLLIFQQPFGIIMSGVGVIALAGIVVNNNIVLIDTHDRLRKTFDDPLEAILHTGVQRLRPVLLTTVTTVLGLLPMMFLVNIDFVNRTITQGAPSMQWWSQLSIAIVSGLTFATVLTLIVTPSLLMLKENIAAAIARRRNRHAGAPAVAE